MQPIAVIALLCVWAAAVSAQPVDLKPDVRIRLRAAPLAWETVGTVVSTSEDSLRVRVEGTRTPISFWWNDVTRLEVSRGRPGLWTRALSGLAFGAGVGLIMIGEAIESSSFKAPVARDVQGPGGRLYLFGAGIGGLAGYLTAAGTSREQWVRVIPDTTQTNRQHQR